MNGEAPRPGRLPATPARVRAVAVVVTTVALVGAMLMEAGGASAATVVQAWQTRVGTRLTDTSTLTAYDTGSGILRIRAGKMRASSTFAVTVYKGSCGRYVSTLGPVLFTLPSVTSSTSGAITRNLAVTAARVRQVRSAWYAGAGVVLVLRRGSSRWCGDFAALGSRGRTVRLENEQNHLVSRAERWAGTGLAEPEAGGAYVTIYVRIKALRKTAYDGGNYTLRDPTGTDWRRPIAMWDVREPALGSGVLLAGQTAEGWITTIAPEKYLGSLTLAYRMHASGYIVGQELVTLFVPLGTLAQPTPSPSPSPGATPIIEPTPTPGI